MVMEDPFHWSREYIYLSEGKCTHRLPKVLIPQAAKIALREIDMLRTQRNATLERKS